MACIFAQLRNTLNRSVAQHGQELNRWLPSQAPALHKDQFSFTLKDMKKLQQYLLSSFLSLFLTCSGITFASAATNSTSNSIPGFSEGTLEKMVNAIVKTGLSPTQIPALNYPQYMNVADASLSLDDDEIVFIIHYPDGHIRIYPQRILVWHQVLNDVLPDKYGNLPDPNAPEAAYLRYTITYSPLTGSVVAFQSMAGKYPTWFDSRGDVLNNNMILHDFISESTWSQLLAACITGPMKGKRLQRIPILWATWKGVKNRYLGKAEVLSNSTGFRRSYGKDPYGSYQIKGTYYDNNLIPYPLTHLDRRLPPKKRILGIEIDSATSAVVVDAVQEQQLLNFEMGITPLVALYDAELNAVRIFKRSIDNPMSHMLTFTVFEEKFVDTNTKSEWTPEGECIYGQLRGMRLTPVLSTDSMWFAWAAFYRNTSIFPQEKTEKNPTPR